MNKTSKITYNLSKHCKVIIKKYGFKAEVLDVVYRSWTPEPCPILVQKGFVVTIGLGGGHIGLLRFDEAPMTMKERRMLIIDCLSSHKLMNEEMISREVN